jgi:LmbE family N-acetylglucosaminyl deacetylase
MEKSLLVVAHPDDEVLYFGGLLLGAGQKLWPESKNIRVVLVTDANADGKGTTRLKQFHLAMKRLKVKNFVTLNFPDRFESRLDTESLTKALKRITQNDIPKTVFTHGIVGEYGHPHHQDVSFSVHAAFQKTATVWSVADHAYPEKTITLTPKQFSEKGKILSQIYGSETMRFQNFISNRAIESFHQVSWTEVRSIYRYLIGEQKSLLKIERYKAYKDYLKNLGAGKHIPRPF